MNLEQAVKKKIRILDAPPEGWRKLGSALTAPEGYAWYSNNRPRFEGEYEHAIVKEAVDE